MFRSSIRVTLIGLKSRVFRLGIGSALLGLLLSILVPLSNAYSSDQGALPLPPSHPKLDAFKKLVGADLVHKLGYTGKGVTVAVIDDGIQANHVQFQNRILAEVCVSNDFEPSFNPYVCKKQGSGLYVRDDGAEIPYIYSEGEGSAEVEILSDGIVYGSGGGPSHGVSVASSVLEFAPDVKLVPIKGLGWPRDALSSLVWLRDNATRLGVDIVVMSFGSPNNKRSSNNENDCTTNSGNPEAKIHAQIMSDLLKQNVIPLAASMNNGEFASMWFPACIPGVVSVGALEPNDTLASYSNVDLGLDLIAPSGFETAKSGRTKEQNDEWREYFGGTSQATPVAAAMLAVGKQIRPDLNAKELIAAAKESSKLIGDDILVDGLRRIDFLQFTQLLLSGRKSFSEPKSNYKSEPLKILQIPAELNEEILKMLPRESYRKLLGVNSVNNEEVAVTWTPPQVTNLTRIKSELGLNELISSRLTGQGATIAVLDSGLDMTHPQFQGRVVAEVCATHEGSDFCSSSVLTREGAGAATDLDNGHGTSITSAILNFAPQARIVKIRFDYDVRSIRTALQWLIDNAAKYQISVVNMSIGGQSEYRRSSYFYSSEKERLLFCRSRIEITDKEDLLKKLVSMGILPIVATGNSGMLMQQEDPSCSKYAISVGSSLNQQKVADHSNVSPRTTFLAPFGFEIASVHGKGEDQSNWNKFCGGTSCSAPVVSAMAATLIARFPDSSPYQVLKAMYDSGEVVNDVVVKGLKTIHFEKAYLELEDALLAGEYKAALELKAKQEAEARAAAEKAAAELKAKQEAEARAAAEKAATKKITIICKKGKITKKVTGIKPRCPKGFVRK